MSQNSIAKPRHHRAISIIEPLFLTSASPISDISDSDQAEPERLTENNTKDNNHIITSFIITLKGFSSFHYSLVFHSPGL